MADPVISNGIRVQSIWQGVSGLPEDRFVNTWAFSTPGAPSDAQLDEAMDAVEAFFNTTPSGGGPILRTIIPAASIDVGSSELRAYRMGDTPPRVPRIQALAPGSLGATDPPYPAEVAICASFYAGANQPGRRGRVFIGPIIEGIQDAADGYSRPHASLLDSVCDAMQTLAGRSSDVVWCVLGKHGTLPRSLSPVTGGWCDNAWDTQRRRGPDPTARETWVLP